MTESLVDIRETLSEFVRCNSIAKELGGPGEHRLAEKVTRLLSQIDPNTTIHYGPNESDLEFSYLLYAPEDAEYLLVAHLDTVGIETDDELEPYCCDGDLFGRGSLDMKAGLVASLAAIERAQLDGKKIGLLAVADEEVNSTGMSRALEYEAKRISQFPFAVVTEPTQMVLINAHRGFVWLSVTVRGRAAHGSLHKEGIDANLRMAQFLCKLGEANSHMTSHDPLLGASSLHVAQLHGGEGPSVYAGKCEALIEWRTVPGEDADSCKRSLLDIAASLEFDICVEVRMSRPPFANREPPEPIFHALRSELLEVEMSTAPFWTDAALLAPYINTVVLGPKGEGMHTDREWVDLASVEKLAQVLHRIALQRK